MSKRPSSMNHLDGKAATGLLLGIAIGVGVGVALDNIGAGIAIGVALGLAFAAGQRRRGAGVSDRRDEDPVGDPPG